MPKAENACDNGKLGPDRLHLTVESLFLAETAYEHDNGKEREGKLAAPPWGSVYLDSESVLFGDSCIALGRWMRARGIELHEGESREPVDHIGRMLVLLSWLCDNQPDQVIPFMEEHLMTWAPRYFAQLEPAAAGTLYEPLGHLASLTLEGVPLLRQS